jgi:3-phenylpropionate/trans-cinnamate dioxygenase ferredoxin subunit
MNPASKYTWFKLADSIAELFPEGKTMLACEVNSKKLCITYHKDILYACTATCPHAGGKLAEGYVDALGNIVCPIHRYKFSLQNGRNSSGEGYYLKTYPVEVRPEGIFVGFEEKNLFNWFK